MLPMEQEMSGGKPVGQKISPRLRPPGESMMPSWLLPGAAALLAAALLAVVVFLAAPPEAGAVTADDPLVGTSDITPSQMEAELDTRNPNHIVPGIAQMYTDMGYRFGIRSDLAFAQMLLETNFLRYGGAGGAEPWQNNFAGIGVTGGSRGNVFATPELGVIGHYAHLAWYAFPDHQNAYCSSAFDPRHFGNVHANTAHTLRELGGRWAVPGTTYGNDIARLANEIRRFPPSGMMLGSFNEMPSAGDGMQAGAYYFPWYDSLPQDGMGGNWILVMNKGTGDATVEIYIGNEKMHDPGNPGNDFFTIPEGGEAMPVFPGKLGGPVRVVSVSGQPLLASQRVIYRDSFNEVLGVPAGALADSYEFTWYDSMPQHGMTGNWILISNQGNQPADVGVWVGGAQVAAYTAAAGNAIPPGGTITPVFPMVLGGPVEVRSTNHQPLITSQRVLYQQSFSEVMGQPAAGLSTEYYFTWYDLIRAHGMNGDWVLVANQGSLPAAVNIFVGGRLVASYSDATGNAIPPGGIVTPQFDGLMDGPVYVHSLNGQPLLASQRVLFRNSFEEVQGRPASSIEDQWFPWYDSKRFDYMAGDWLLISNLGSSDARVRIEIGNLRLHDAANPGNDYFTVPARGRITPSFTNLMGGPVHVVSLDGQPLLASQRVLYKDGLIR